MISGYKIRKKKMEKPGQERDIIDQNDFTRVRENRKIYHF
jgi:hypothetical protein